MPKIPIYILVILDYSLLRHYKVLIQNYKQSYGPNSRIHIYKRLPLWQYKTRLSHTALNRDELHRFWLLRASVFLTLIRKGRDIYGWHLFPNFSTIFYDILSVFYVHIDKISVHVYLIQTRYYIWQMEMEKY